MRSRRCAIVLSGILFTWMGGCGSDNQAPLELGIVAPSFTLPAVDGKNMVSSETLQGKITVLNFWSTSCSVCLKETEDLERIHDTGKAAVIGIALDTDSEHLGQFVKSKGIKYPILVGNEEVFLRYDGAAIPYTLVLDQNRTVRKRAYGRMAAEDIERVIEEIEGKSAALATANGSHDLSLSSQ